MLAWTVYRPGLSGGFLFDDFVNLPALGASGRVDDWPAFWRYVTSGTADPIGRPLSLLSFLIDARDWPADATPFLRTNVLLHLLNGILLFLLLRTLEQRIDDVEHRSDASALLGAGLWLLHPLFVSTTLYVVQREAMLPATFVLLGLLAWLRGRALLEHNVLAGGAWMVGGIGLGTMFAMLCKANGVLLPLLAWSLEATVLARHDRKSGARTRACLHKLRWLLLVVPTLLVLGYLASQFGANPVLEHRPWTLLQRLMTEPRALVEYLHLLVVPRVLSNGLYNDAYPFSKDLLEPPTTLLALVALCAMLALSFALRRRAPALAAGLLFFFAGHLLESTVVPLELYFEHRNYLPAMLLFWPLARGIVHLPTAAIWRICLAGIAMSICAAITFQRAELWGNPGLMALHWVRVNPQSPRAQATAAEFDIDHGRPGLALQRLQAAMRARPADLQLVLNHANAMCASRGLDAAEITLVANALREAASGGQLVHGWIAGGLERLATGQGCDGMDIAVLQRWIDAARANPRFSAFPGVQLDLHSLAGRVALQLHQPELALDEFDRALRILPAPQVAAKQAALLATAGYYQQALRHLDHYDALPRKPEPRGLSMSRLHGRVLQAQEFWPREFAVLRMRLREDAARQGTGAPAP